MRGAVDAVGILILAAVSSAVTGRPFNRLAAALSLWPFERESRVLKSNQSRSPFLRVRVRSSF